MLGLTLKDPLGVEAGGEIRGMGLLPLDTVFAGEKTRTRVSGSFADALPSDYAELSGAYLEGYEIHMGETTFREGIACATRIRDQITGKEKQDGACAGNVCGTYVHGVFDRPETANALIRALGRRKGIDVSQMTGTDFAAFKETQYDILAAALREHLDLERIYRILEEGVPAR